MEDGRITVVFRIPNEHVEDVLATSGKHGIIVDLDTQTNEEKEDPVNLVSIKMPAGKEIADILKSIDDLPPQLRNTTRGPLLNFDGLRSQSPTTRRRIVDEAAQYKGGGAMGPALGLRTTSS